ncbi:hypothetical protein NA898_15930 [Proteus cibi]|uniref:Uncharacterized protein n=1 Tax=Proteus cibi TaxID=2050966 RepID=A0ABU6EHL0_9GAMM|nr:DUF6707 family protein [Proteus cibi]MEB6858556.1 hypothetical protein [Proteus cibi]MEB7090021.1 hypothetical protein [Proteus cibi]
MNLNSLITKLNEDDNYVNLLSRSEKKTKKSYLENIVKMTYKLYFKNNEKYKKLLNLLCDVDFENDYNYWTWIEYALLLKIYDNEIKGNDNSIYIEKINYAINSGSELEIHVKKNIIERINLSSFEYSSNKIKDIDTLIENLIRLLKIRFFSLNEKSKVDLIISSIRLNTL